MPSEKKCIRQSCRKCYILDGKFFLLFWWNLIYHFYAFFRKRHFWLSNSHFSKFRQNKTKLPPYMKISLSPFVFQWFFSLIICFWVILSYSKILSEPLFENMYKIVQKMQSEKKFIRKSCRIICGKYFCHFACLCILCWWDSLHGFVFYIWGCVIVYFMFVRLRDFVFYIWKVAWFCFSYL